MYGFTKNENVTINSKENFHRFDRCAQHISQTARCAQHISRITIHQDHGTPGIVRTINVKPHTWYVFVVEGYKQNIFSDIGTTYLNVDAKDKIDFSTKNNINFTSENKIYDIIFNSGNNTTITLGILVQNPSIKEKFYVSSMKFHSLQSSNYNPEENMPNLLENNISKHAAEIEFILTPMPKKKIKKEKIEKSEQPTISKSLPISKPLPPIPGRKPLPPIPSLSPTINKPIPPLSPTINKPLPPIPTINQTENTNINKQTMIDIENEPKYVLINDVPIPNKALAEYPKYVFVVTGFNCDKWVAKCAESIITQKITNWICVLCDDASKDKTWSIIQRLTIDGKIFAYRNTKNQGACHTRYFGLKSIEKHFHPEDVIILVSADDYLTNSKSLSSIHNKYNQGAQVTYGNWMALDGTGFTVKKFPSHILENRDYRSYRWTSTAVHTFKNYLFQALTPEDFQEPDGKWIKNCTDLAVMFPVMEMADPKRIFRITKYIYMYNSDYGHNTKNRFGLQNKSYYHKIIRAKPKKDLHPLSKICSINNK